MDVVIRDAADAAQIVVVVAGAMVLPRVLVTVVDVLITGRILLRTAAAVAGTMRHFRLVSEKEHGVVFRTASVPETPPVLTEA